MAVVGNVVLALAEGVPELDGPVSRAGDDLSVVGREGNREDVGGVANELLGGHAGVEVPESEGLVPRRGQGELAVRRDNDVRDKVVVAVQDLLGEAERRVVPGELPDNGGLVCLGQLVFTGRRYAPVASSSPPAVMRRLPRISTP